MKNILTINERILYIIDNQYGGNKKKFADSINYAAQVVFNIVAGRKSSLSFDVLNAIISTNDNINTDWLLAGKGSMLKNEVVEVERGDGVDYKELYFDAKYTIDVQKK